jgi:ABC-type dipeptide/oligopeptide/nickel transport system ATPase subunit
MTAGFLEVKDLHVAFGHGQARVHAVRGVSFSVAQGECFGIVGESGSGKTTVLRALCGLNHDWQGEVLMAGRKVPRTPDKAFCRTVQIVFQDPYGSLHPRQTVDRCLREPLEIQGIGDRDRRIVETLQAVGLDRSFRYRYPHQLSGGQRQRVGIARALMLEPKLLFLDEPTSALDVSVQAEILNLLVRLRKERGFTYVLVTHDLAIISHMCERLIVMNVGRIVEAMPVEALRSRTPENPYTQQLLQASLGYDRSAVERYQTFD